MVLTHSSTNKTILLHSLTSTNDCTITKVAPGQFFCGATNITIKRILHEWRWATPWMILSSWHSWKIRYFFLFSFCTQNYSPNICLCRKATFLMNFQPGHFATQKLYISPMHHHMSAACQHVTLPRKKGVDRGKGIAAPHHLAHHMVCSVAHSTLDGRFVHSRQA